MSANKVNVTISGYKRAFHASMEMKNILIISENKDIPGDIFLFQKREIEFLK